MILDITYHDDYKNKYHYRIVMVFDEKLMHQVCLSMFDVFYRCSKLVSINLGWRATYGSMISSHDHIIKCI